jgi:hypothetical protein
MNNKLTFNGRTWSTAHKAIKIGDKVGNLTCISEEFKNPTIDWKGKRLYIKVRCDCGSEYTVRKGTFTDGKPNKKRCFKCGRKGSANSNKNGCGEVSGRYMSTIRCGAKRRKLEYKITAKDAWEQFVKQNHCCALSGQKLVLSYDGDRNSSNTASLDRIDSTLGYVLGNIQWLHKNINVTKFSFPQYIYIKLCCMVADHYRSINKKDDQS